MIIISGFVCMESHLHQVNDSGQDQKIAREGSYGPGGSAVNKAIAAARNGARVNFIGTIGDDLFGKTIEIFFMREGILVSGLAKSNTPTGLHVFTHQDGKPTQSVLFQGANEDFRLSQIPHAKLNSRTLLLMENNDDPAFAELLEAAKFKQAITVIYTTEDCGKIDYADYIILESKALKPNKGSHVITLSPCRSYAHCLEKSGEIYSSEIKDEILGKIIDDSGVFDAFTGSFASCIQAGLPLSGALRFAHVTAWLTGQKRGTNAAIPYLDSVETALTKAA